MICENCGAELEKGALRCYVCGHDIQIVPEYNELEDDILNEIIASENPIQKEKEEKLLQKKREELEKKRQKQKRNRNIMIAAFVSVIVILLVLLILLFTSKVRSDHANSFDYQLTKGQEAEEEGNLTAALKYYEAAAALEKDNLDVRLTMLRIYMDQEDYDSALVMGQEIIRLDSSVQEAYEDLLSIYLMAEDYDSIRELYDQAPNEEIASLFAGYIVPTPKFNIYGGSYDYYFDVELYSDEGNLIYYTLDGSDPTEDGILYTDRIPFEDMGQYTVSAVCLNENGLYSDVVTEEYSIDISAPDMPVVNPDGGDFGDETKVTIMVPTGCSAYYTWDGTDPTRDSERYAEPLVIPEGNNVLSVILYDNKTGFSSEIYRGNFIYYNENTDEEEP